MLQAWLWLGRAALFSGESRLPRRALLILPLLCVPSVPQTPSNETSGLAGKGSCPQPLRLAHGGRAGSRQTRVGICHFVLPWEADGAPSAGLEACPCPGLFAHVSAQVALVLSRTQDLRNISRKHKVKKECTISPGFSVGKVLLVCVLVLLRPWQSTERFS